MGYQDLRMMLAIMGDMKMEMKVDEKYIKLEIAMGTTLQDIKTFFEKLFENKEMDCPSKMLKAIMNQDLPDGIKAMMCYEVGRAQGAADSEKDIYSKTEKILDQIERIQSEGSKTERSKKTEIKMMYI